MDELGLFIILTMVVSFLAGTLFGMMGERTRLRDDDEQM